MQGREKRLYKYFVFFFLQIQDILIMITTTNLNHSNYELEQVFQKLASIVPTISNNQSLSELEFIDLVIDYIKQLQQALLRNQIDEHINILELTSCKKFSSLPSKTIFAISCRLILSQPLKIQINDDSLEIFRNPLASINPENTKLP